MTTRDSLQHDGAPPRFRDRREAGRFLAAILCEREIRGTPLVLGIPRGGIPVAQEVAQALGAPLDVLVVQKIALPVHTAWDEPPVAGAVAREGTRIVDARKLAANRIAAAELEEAIAVAERERSRRESLYRNGCAFPEVRDRTVILVDDGIETGITMRAAIAALHAMIPGEIVVAVPVGTSAVCREIEPMVDALICPLQLPDFAPIHGCYDDFARIGDEEVRALIEAELYPQKSAARH